MLLFRLCLLSVWSRSGGGRRDNKQTNTWSESPPSPRASPSHRQRFPAAPKPFRSPFTGRNTVSSAGFHGNANSSVYKSNTAGMCWTGPRRWITFVCFISFQSSPEDEQCTKSAFVQRSCHSSNIWLYLLFRLSDGIYVNKNTTILFKRR